MSDILERLKNYVPGENDDCVSECIAEAISEIERLRSRAQELPVSQALSDAPKAAWREQKEEIPPLVSTHPSTGRDSTHPLCSCKASQRDGQHMMWCPALAPPPADREP